MEQLKERVKQQLNPHQGGGFGHRRSSRILSSNDSVSAWNNAG